MDEQEMKKEQEIKSQFYEKIDNFKRTSLVINRIPEQTKTEFMELAKSEFSSDYGFLVKWLLDYRKGLLSNPNEMLQEEINLLAERVVALEKKFETPKEEKKEIKRADGITR